MPIKRRLCDSCNPFSIDWSVISIGEIKKKARYQRAARLRKLARSIYHRSEKPRCCAMCGYDKHYEVCHIKPINDFPDSALVAEVNDLNNLVALCPNHHWELDNGLLIMAPSVRIERTTYRLGGGRSIH